MYPLHSFHEFLRNKGDCFGLVSWFFFEHMRTWSISKFHLLVCITRIQELPGHFCVSTRLNSSIIHWRLIRWSIYIMKKKTLFKYGFKCRACRKRKCVSFFYIYSSEHLQVYLKNQLKKSLQLTSLRCQRICRVWTEFIT